MSGYVFRGSWRKRFRWKTLRFEMGRTVELTMAGYRSRKWEWMEP